MVKLQNLLQEQQQFIKNVWSAVAGTQARLKNVRLKIALFGLTETGERLKEEEKMIKMIINIIKKTDKHSQNLMTDIDMDLIYGYYLQHYLENDDVEVLDSEELEKEIKKSGFDVRDGKIVRNEQFKQLIKVKT